MDKMLTAKTAIVNGVTGAIGLRIVRGLLKADATVIVPLNSADEILFLNSSCTDILSGRLITELTDIQDHVKMNDLVENCVEEFGAIDIAIADLDQHWSGPSLSDLEFNEWEKVTDKCLTGFFVFGSCILHQMKANGQGIFMSISDFENTVQKPYSSLINVISAARLEMMKAFQAELSQSKVQYHHYNRQDLTEELFYHHFSGKSI